MCPKSCKLHELGSARYITKQQLYPISPSIGSSPRDHIYRLAAGGASEAQVAATSAAMKGSADPSYGKHPGITGMICRGCFPEGYNDGQLN